MENKIEPSIKTVENTKSVLPFCMICRYDITCSAALHWKKLVGKVQTRELYPLDIGRAMASLREIRTDCRKHKSDKGEFLYETFTISQSCVIIVSLDEQAEIRRYWCGGQQGR